MTMEERIIGLRKRARQQKQVSKTVPQAIKDLEELGFSEEAAIKALSKIIGVRKECVSNFLNRSSLPRGNYKKTLEKLQEFSTVYVKTGGFFDD